MSRDVEGIYCTNCGMEVLGPTPACEDCFVSIYYLSLPWDRISCWLLNARGVIIVSMGPGAELMEYVTGAETLLPIPARYMRTHAVYVGVVVPSGDLRADWHPELGFGFDYPGYFRSLTQLEASMLLRRDPFVERKPHLDRALEKQPSDVVRELVHRQASGHVHHVSRHARRLCETRDRRVYE